MLLSVTAKTSPLGAGEFDKLGGFGERRRQWLVADDVDPGFQKRLGDRKVKVVRGDDDRGLDPVRALGLANRHFTIVRIGPVGREAQVGAGGARVFRVRGQGARLQFDQIVEPHRHAMNRADERVAAAADHADAQASAPGPLDRRGVDHRL